MFPLKVDEYSVIIDETVSLVIQNVFADSPEENAAHAYYREIRFRMAELPR